MRPLSWFLKLILPEGVDPESRKLLKVLTPQLVYLVFVVVTIDFIRSNFEEHTFAWNLITLILLIIVFLLAFCSFVYGTLVLDEYFDVPDWQRI